MKTAYNVTIAIPAVATIAPNIIQFKGRFCLTQRQWVDLLVEFHIANLVLELVWTFEMGLRLVDKWDRELAT